MNEEIIIAQWIAAIVKAAGGQIFIPYNALAEIGKGYSLHYDQKEEGILLSLKQNWVLDVSGYTADIAPFHQGD